MTDSDILIGGEPINADTIGLDSRLDPKKKKQYIIIGSISLVILVLIIIIIVLAITSNGSSENNSNYLNQNEHYFNLNEYKNNNAINLNNLYGEYEAKKYAIPKYNKVNMKRFNNNSKNVKNTLASS